GELTLEPVRLEGFNTDVYGFEESLKPLLTKEHTQALVLGHGGAARAVIYVLKKLNIDYQIVSRKATHLQLAYQDVTPAIMKSHKLIINTTPLGMAPAVEACPEIPYTHIGREHLLYDLVYNPEETLFLEQGRK